MDYAFAYHDTADDDGSTKTALGLTADETMSPIAEGTIGVWTGSAAVGDVKGTGAKYAIVTITVDSGYTVPSELYGQSYEVTVSGEGNVRLTRTADSKFKSASLRGSDAAMTLSFAANGTPSYTNNTFYISLQPNRTNGDEYKLKEAFDKSHAYAVGDIVSKVASEETKYYKFTSAHSAGNEWNDSEVSELNGTSGEIIHEFDKIAVSIA